MNGKEKLHKILLYSLVFFFMFMLQELFFSRIPVWGFILLPIPCAVIALSVIESAPFGVFFGLACGLILDVSGGSALFWHTVMLMCASYLAGRVLTNWIRQSLLSAISLSVCLYIIGECLHILLLYVFTGSAGFLTVFTAAIPSALLSSILSIPFAVLLRHIHRNHSEA